MQQQSSTAYTPRLTTPPFALFGKAAFPLPYKYKGSGHCGAKDALLPLPRCAARREAPRATGAWRRVCAAASPPVLACPAKPQLGRKQGLVNNPPAATSTANGRKLLLRAAASWGPPRGRVEGGDDTDDAGAAANLGWLRYSVGRGSAQGGAGGKRLPHGVNPTQPSETNGGRPPQATPRPGPLPRRGEARLPPASRPSPPGRPTYPLAAQTTLDA